jgi:hypothetical protein
MGMYLLFIVIIYLLLLFIVIIYIGVCSSLVALFLWQQVTNIAAVMTLMFHPVDMGVYQNWVCFQILCGSV